MQTQRSFLWRRMVISALVPSLLLAGCLGTPTAHQPNSPVSTPVSQNAEAEAGVTRSSRFESLYVPYTFESMTDEATAIFVGKITSISPPQWNQDSGEDWRKEETDMLAFPIRKLEVEIVTPITETEKFDSPVQIIVIAEDIWLDEKGNIVNHEEMTHGLQTGNQAVFFILKGEMAWRSGIRSAILFLGDPRQSYFKLQDDGLYHGWQIEGSLGQRADTPEVLDLETLTKRILEAKATPPETPK